MIFGGFRPRLAPTLITIPAVLACLALGVWQIERLHWKEALIAAQEAGLAAQPVAVPQTLAEARRLEFHRVFVSGVLLWDNEILLHAIGPEGEAGFKRMTPLREADGRVVLINRGFIPTGWLPDVRRMDATHSRFVGTGQHTGLLRLPPDQKPGWFVPDNQPMRGEWFWLDLPAIAAAEGLDNVAPFTIDADAIPWPNCKPLACATPPPLPNNHLQYAITWFSLAAAGAVIYVLSQRSGGKSSDDGIPRT
jgi:surfeit locus 1 family protein